MTTLTDPVALPGDEERTLLRDSLRGLLHQHWPAEHAPGRRMPRG